MLEGNRLRLIYAGLRPTLRCARPRPAGAGVSGLAARTGFAVTPLEDVLKIVWGNPWADVWFS